MVNSNNGSKRRIKYWGGVDGNYLNLRDGNHSAWEMDTQLLGQERPLTHSFIHLQTIIEHLICALPRWSLCPGGGDRQKCNEGKKHAMKEKAHNEME